MSFLQRHIRLFSGLLGVCVALAVFFTGGYRIADAYRSDLDARLGTNSYIQSGDAGVARYKSYY